MTSKLSVTVESAAEVRRDVVRMIGMARSGRVASALSIVDILVWLYGEVLSVRPEEPAWEERDRFVLSKGHGCPALYAVLARCGFFPRDELWSYRRLGAMLQGHPELRRTPGVDAPAGSLGMGLGLGNGIALALKGRKSGSRVCCLAGDGELQEGAFWEAALVSSRHSLDNLLLVIDRNGLQGEGATEKILPLDSLKQKILSFGWSVEECDGHDFDSLRKGVSRLETLPCRPRCLLAKTRLGKGISFLENDPSGGRMVLDRGTVDKALLELEREEDLL